MPLPTHARLPPPPPSVTLTQVYLNKPLGVKFARGNDGGAYVVRTDATLGNTTADIQVRTDRLEKSIDL